MKRKCLAVTALMILSLLLTLTCSAGETPLQNGQYYTPLQNAAGETHATVDTLTLYPSDDTCAFSGKDTAPDGTVTITAGNTYNFSLDLATSADAGWVDITGLFFYQELGGERHGQFLPLNEDGVYAYLWGFRPDDSNDFVSNNVLTEHIDFVDVALNESVSAGSSAADNAPVFGLTGKVVITYSFEASGALTDSSFQNRYFDENILNEGDVVTYTLTIDGESSAISTSDYLLTGDDGTAYYSVGIGYKPTGSNGAFPASVYSLTIEENGSSSSYDFLEDRSNERCMETDIWLRVLADYTIKQMEPVEDNSGAEDPASSGNTMAVSAAEESTVSAPEAAENGRIPAASTSETVETAGSTGSSASDSRILTAVILLAAAAAGAAGIAVYVFFLHGKKSGNKQRKH